MKAPTHHLRWKAKTTQMTRSDHLLQKSDQKRNAMMNLMRITTALVLVTTMEETTVALSVNYLDLIDGMTTILIDRITTAAAVTTPEESL